MRAFDIGERVIFNTNECKEGKYFFDDLPIHGTVVKINPSGSYRIRLDVSVPFHKTSRLSEWDEKSNEFNCRESLLVADADSIYDENEFTNTDLNSIL